MDGDARHGARAARSRWIPRERVGGPTPDDVAADGRLIALRFRPTPQNKSSLGAVFAIACTVLVLAMAGAAFLIVGRTHKPVTTTVAASPPPSPPPTPTAVDPTPTVLPAPPPTTATEVKPVPTQATPVTASVTSSKRPVATVKTARPAPTGSSLFDSRF